MTSNLLLDSIQGVQEPSKSTCKYLNRKILLRKSSLKNGLMVTNDVETNIFIVRLFEVDLYRQLNVNVNKNVNTSPKKKKRILPIYTSDDFRSREQKKEVRRQKNYSKQNSVAKEGATDGVFCSAAPSTNENSALSTTGRSGSFLQRSPKEWEES